MTTSLLARRLLQFCFVICLSAIPAFSQGTYPVPLELTSQGVPCGPEYDGFCLNGGECERIPGISRPRCSCPLEYMGERCDRPNILALQEASQLELWDIYIIVSALGGALVALLVLGMGCIIYRKCGKTEPRPELV
ncbi:PREDICTED: OMEGA-stichotoxin-Sgt1a-like [Branchiostoma belcheri]|uniref:Pro-neuregulin-4, membrane-bound isoform n=1 Tax=Branchiostoma belcheri TaxID=7741 RepID=A0A6P4ZW04_BRABE|nr:PREDICTED: OMEGA-stichotoxin-Sgt1a-like [Branchiostoma belcheri]